MRRKIFRREIIFPILALAFICASAEASSGDELAGQAAVDLHCGSVSVVRAGANEFLATGCGQDRVYTCDDQDQCTSNVGAKVTRVTTDPDSDDEAAEAVASALTDMACACASAGLASHGSHSHSSSHAHKRD